MLYGIGQIDSIRRICQKKSLDQTRLRCFVHLPTPRVGGGALPGLHKPPTRSCPASSNLHCRLKKLNSFKFSSSGLAKLESRYELVIEAGTRQPGFTSSFTGKVLGASFQKSHPSTCWLLCQKSLEQRQCSSSNGYTDLVT